jgi:hypothetical protein
MYIEGKAGGAVLKKGRNTAALLFSISLEKKKVPCAACARTMMW